MVNRIIPTIVLLCLLLSGNLSAQTKGILPSVDEHADSVAFMEMRGRMETIRKERPAVALVLAGGGALGAAHVGVIKYIEELGIPVDMIVGTSIGGLVGGFYSLGYSGKQLDSLLRSADWGTLMSDAIPAGLYSGDKRERVEKYCLSVPYKYDEEDWVRRQSPGSRKPARKQNFVSSISEGYLYGFNIINYFNSKTAGYHDDMSLLDLPTPFVCTATDLASGCTKNWTSGSVVDAIRSTMSIPFAFMPVRKDDKVYVDGGVRNNFPVDIARAMGADVVIGVDLHLPSNLEDASSVVQLVYMTATRPGADSAYESNIKDADIFIEPDLTGYNILSFNEKAISVLEDRGYVAAEGGRLQLEELAQQTGGGGRKLSNRCPVDITGNQVMIGSIEFAGLTDDEAEYFMPKIGLKAGNRYAAGDFEKAVAVIYGTGAFSRATYKLLGGSEPYHLLIVCEKGPVNEFLLGLRADSEELLSATFGLGINTNKIRGTKMLLSGKVGKVSDLRLDWKYEPHSAPSLNAFIETSYSAFRGLNDNGMDDGDGYRGEFWHNEAAVFLSDNCFRNMDADLGVKVENTPVFNEYGGMTYRSGNWEDVWACAFLKASFNTLDNKYFPTRGFKASAGYEYLIYGNGAGSDAGTSKGRYACLDMMVPVTSGRFTLIPSIYSRMVAGGDGASSNRYMGNVIGGAVDGRYFTHQIQFIGYNGVKRVGDRLGMAGLDLRYKASPKTYVSAIGQMYNDSIGRGAWNEHTVYACALKYSIATMLGPVSANVHWSSDTRKAGIYLSAGLDF